MKILAIESSSSTLYLAIQNEKKIFHLKSDSINNTAKNINSMVDKILKKSKTSLNEIDAIAISSGPGSFTSLRVGMSYAKGLSLTLDIPIVPISTFEILLFSNIKKVDGDTSVVIYSHGRTVYKCDYKINADTYKLINEPNTFKIDELKNLQKNIIFKGSEKFFKEFNNDKNNIIVELDIESLLKLSINNFKLLKTKSLDNLSPEYVGNFEIK
tara:strand:+ start:584 stop:1222 length:639 start_codon:yes stop_codon:yes gene_type:complete